MKCLKGTPKSPLIIFTYQSGTNWARIYSDGWCEQGGSAVFRDDTITQIILKVSFSSTNYTVLTATRSTRYDQSYFALPTCISKATSSISIAGMSNCGDYYYDWEAKGYVNLEDPTVKKFIDDHS